MEKCGFLCHVLLLPLGFVYIAFILRGMFLDAASKNIEPSFFGESRQENKDNGQGLLAVVPVIGTVMVALFLATPITYFLLNHYLVTGMPQAATTVTKTTPTGARRRTCTTTISTSGIITTTTTDGKDTGKTSDSAIPDICDVDVAVINNLIYDATAHEAKA
jgi:hypothetical protein